MSIKDGDTTIERERTVRTVPTGHAEWRIPLGKNESMVENGCRASHVPWPAVSITSIKHIRSSTTSCLR